MLATALWVTRSKACRTSEGRGRGGTCDLNVDGLNVLPCCVFQGLRERACFQARGGKFVHQATGIGEVAPEQICCLAYVLVGGFGGPRALGGLEEEQAAGQALGDGVVDLAGNALALSSDSGFTLLGGELLLGLGDVVEKPALQGRVALDLVVDQGEHGARCERAEQHGDVRPVAHPEEPDCGSGRRRASRHVAGPA